ncbi:hypothetical protein CROQUDRAFT_94364 [Cronartium quercuum f. sp. fusiforme G11]|uniref:Uncharacterized protein n=1 Tax=Cronartium quercuum f. sp. fusiforme G11 TaxID=708437 RepID=A0A9P6NK36_9BASI|nr:hypothetical protein CROQUDRAFT_94364 [Cronartium quercuum f. sp. fusiforme G11]
MVEKGLWGPSEAGIGRIQLRESRKSVLGNPVFYGTKRGRGFGYLPDFKHESEVGKPTSKSVAKQTLGVENIHFS